MTISRVKFTPREDFLNPKFASLIVVSSKERKAEMEFKKICENDGSRTHVNFFINREVSVKSNITVNLFSSNEVL